MSPENKTSIVFCPRPLGRRLVFQQGDPHASGRGARGRLHPEQPRHTRGRRRPQSSARSGGSAARPSSSATPTAAPSSRLREPTTASPVSSTSPHSLPTTTRPRRASRTSSPRPTSFGTSRSPTAASGCSRTASSASPETCPRRSRSSSGRRKACRPWTCSTRRSQAPPGGRSRAGTSWPRTTAPSTPNSSASSAKRMGAKTYEVDSSHVPMLSHPDLVLDVIRDGSRTRPSRRHAAGRCSAAGLSNSKSEQRPSMPMASDVYAWAGAGDTCVGPLPR